MRKQVKALLGGTGTMDANIAGGQKGVSGKQRDMLNEFVLDALRACATGKKKIGGLGVVIDKDDYTILRGTGKNVKANRLKTPKEIEGFLSLRCMQNALLTNRAVYETLVRSL